MLGLKHITVKLVPHSYQWKYLFQEEAKNIREVLNNRTLVIEHVGSTSLPEIAAKPILDMFIPCNDLSSALEYTDALATLGYELVTNGSLYKLFIKGSEEARTHHLTFTNPLGTYWNETLQFRDYLLANPETAKAYETEKIKLAEQYSESRLNYSSNKARFIQSILRTINSKPEDDKPSTLLSTHINPRVNTLSPSDLEPFIDFGKTTTNINSSTTTEEHCTNQA